MLSLNGGFIAFFIAMRARTGLDRGWLTDAVSNLLLFTIFATHHSLLARTGAKRFVRLTVGAHLERSVYVWIASLLYAATWLFWRPLPGIVFRHTGALAVIHWSVVAAGIWITLAASRLIDPLDLAGVHQATRRTFPSTLEVSGPYRWVRHPIYFGWLLIVFGGPGLTWTQMEFAVVSSGYLALAIPFEERSLVDAFGESYRAYQRQVRWRMVPGVW